MHGRKHQDSQQEDSLTLLRRLEEMAKENGLHVPHGRRKTEFGMVCTGLFLCWCANTLRCHPSCWGCFAVLPWSLCDHI